MTPPLSQVSDHDLITSAESSIGAAWACSEAGPLIQELAFRLRRATQWYARANVPLLTADGLLLMGFREDCSHGHPIYIRDVSAVDDEWRTALDLLPAAEGGYHAEVHNYEVVDGARTSDVDQRVALPLRLRTYGDLRRLCGALGDRWMQREVTNA